MNNFLQESADQNHPMRALKDFLDQEAQYEKAKMHNKRRFVGYILDIGYEAITIITSDPFKISVGGIPRNSILIMVPDKFEYKEESESTVKLPLHFTVLRVLDSAPTPLSSEVQQTYFELQKKSMPELDIFTQGELQWGALKTEVLGMFYPHPEQRNSIEFSGDLNNFVSAHKYHIYAPDDTLLHLITNSIVPQTNRFCVGKLRLTECRLPLINREKTNVDVHLSTNDFLASRTAMFGKTRLGKSNVVKLVIQSLLETTDPNKSVYEVKLPTLQVLKNDEKYSKELLTYLYSKRDTKFEGIDQFRTGVLNQAPDLENHISYFESIFKTSVGQLIFDINGEYANDNPQDGNKSIRSAYEDRCVVYALSKKPSTPSKQLQINFYEHPKESHKLLTPILEATGRGNSIYVDNFLEVDVPGIQEYKEASPETKKRVKRKILIYWAILHRAGFKADENILRQLLGNLSPEFSAAVINAIYSNGTPPTRIDSLDELAHCLELAAEVNRAEPLPSSTRGKHLFDADDVSLLDFLKPKSSASAGPGILKSQDKYHNLAAGNFTKEILKLLDEGKTVIVDLGNANEKVAEFFARDLSKSIFRHQTEKFTANRLFQQYIQIYFEEAHNLFKDNDTSKETEIYRRFAKEGAKYHIGMVYSTQSPSTINADLLAQTENFFVAHLASQDDVNKLARVNIAYNSIKQDILQAKTPGYMRMLTRSHRFVISLQANKFSPTN